MITAKAKPLLGPAEKGLLRLIACLIVLAAGINTYHIVRGDYGPPAAPLVDMTEHERRFAPMRACIHDKNMCGFEEAQAVRENGSL